MVVVNVPSHKVFLIKMDFSMFLNPNVFVVSGFSWVNQVIHKRSCKWLNDSFVNGNNVYEWL